MIFQNQPAIDVVHVGTNSGKDNEFPRIDGGLLDFLENTEVIMQT